MVFLLASIVSIVSIALKIDVLSGWGMPLM